MQTLMDYLILITNLVLMTWLFFANIACRMIFSGLWSELKNILGTSRWQKIQTIFNKLLSPAKNHSFKSFSVEKTQKLKKV